MLAARFTLSCLAALCACQIASASQLDAMLSLLAKDVVKALAGTEGTVVAQSDGRVYIDLGKRQGVSEGEIVEISALGDDLIIDPDTGEVLGGAEASVSKVTIDVCKTDHSIGTAPAAVAFKRGDKVRRTLSNKTLLLLPPKSVNRGVDAELKKTILMGVTTELLKTGQLKIIEREKLDSAMKELEFQQSGLVGKDAVGRLGSFVGADVIGVTKVVLFPHHISLFLHLIAVENGELIASFRRTVEKDEDLYRNLGEKPPTVFPNAEMITYEVRLQ